MQSKNKELLFSVTKKDLIFETFRCGGKGGQKQNKTESGVRVKHPASGAVGECRNHREQYQNKKEAFKRMANSDKFKKWHKIEVSKRLGLLDGIDEKVEEMMDPKYLKIEEY